MVKVSDEAITKIKEIIENEILSHVAETPGYLGHAPGFAADSCKQIAELSPHSCDSGYYWIKGESGPVEVYCAINPERFEERGGWMRVANVDMRNNKTACPKELVYHYNSTYDKHYCSKVDDVVVLRGCASMTFPVQGKQYRKVCGKVIGYQWHVPNGFGPSRFTSFISSPYVDGVSITHGSQRQHIFTFAAATSETDFFQGIDAACPCIAPSHSFQGTIRSFVGNDYYCETGNRANPQPQFYFDDPLWDGKGCTGENECCERGGPWFCKDLGGETSDDIDLRLCGNDPGPRDDVVLEQIELYVQ